MLYWATPPNTEYIFSQLAVNIMWYCRLKIASCFNYCDLLIVLPMHEPSIFRGIAVSLLRPVIGSNVEIDVALNWVADVRKQIAAAFK